jgi:hypothetical protein
MSGTGKSVLVRALQADGRRAVDLDHPDWSEWVDTPDAGPGETVEPGRDWVWREDRVRDLLIGARGAEVWVSGCAPNMGRLMPYVDQVVLLTAPVDVIAARLAARPPGEYGSRPEEAARVHALIATVEPLLRGIAQHELDTSGPVADTLDALLTLVEAHPVPPAG